MSEYPRRDTNGTVDAAIDRAVHDLLAHEPPSDLRARVLARIAHRPPAAWWSPARVAWAGATLAVLVAASYFAWPSRPAPAGGSDLLVANARQGVLERPAPPSSLEVPVGGTATLAAALSPAPEPYEFTRPPLVEPLEAPANVAIEPLAESQVAIEPIAIARLSFEAVVIDPLRVGR